MKHVHFRLKFAGPIRIALLYGAFSTLWILASTYLVSASFHDPLDLARFELLKGLLFVLVTSGLLYLLLRFFGYRDIPHSDVADVASPARTLSILALFVAMILIVPLIGFAIIKFHGPQVEQDALKNLAIVAKFKAGQIERWMDERRADSMVLAHSSTQFVRGVGKLAQGDDPENQHRDYVLQKLESLRINYHYSTLLVLSKDLRLLVADGEQTDISPELAEVVSRAVRSGKVERTDLYKSASQIAHLDLVVPIRSVSTAKNEVVAVAVLRVSPELSLYPVIRTWPGVSESAESMLVRRGGDNVLYLSELQHFDGTALAHKSPISESTSPAAMALKTDQPGSMRGLDYIKHDVLAAYHPVAGTDWRIVSKIDRDEVLVPLWNMTLLVSGVAFIFVITISLGLLVLWQQQLRLQRLHALAHKTRSDRLLQHFFEMPFLGMAIVSPTDRKLVRFNDCLCDITGYSREELSNRSCLDFTHADDLEGYELEFGRILDGQSSGFVMERRFFHKDGTVLTVVVDTKCMRNPDKTVDYLFVTVQDITQQKAAETRIHRLTHLYSALSECNKAIVRFTTEQALFEKICEVCVIHGGMKMAWVGIIDSATNMVEPVASYGDDIGYLRDIKISSDADNPYGQGPTGRAIRQNSPYWCQDYAATPITASWQVRSRDYWGSSAAIPISRAGAVVGTLNLYSAEKHAFDAPVKHLLLEMAFDISYALDNLDKELRRKFAETQLSESESKFHLLFDQTLDGLLVMNEQEVMECNPAALAMMGCTQEQILHNPVWVFAPARQIDGMLSREKMQEMQEISRIQGRSRFEWISKRLDGHEFPVEVSMVTIMLNGRQAFYTTLRDVTQQKDAEARIRHLAQYDVLTELPNRTLLADRVNQAINIAQRNQQHLSLMFLDLDRFKNVNDTLGHMVGDELLMQVAKRLLSIVREQDTVSRIGGDEFVLLLLDTNVDGATHVAEKLMNAIAEPFRANHHEISITPSIGVAVYPDDGRDFDDLLKSADIAMYRAKQSGRNNYHFFTTKMQEDSMRTMQLTNALHHAVTLDQLSLNFQPQISLHDGSIIGAEALLRWHHPEFGWVAPNEFVPVAEDTGDIYKIGEWVLQQSMHQLKQWQNEGMALKNIAVNLSAVQFRNPQLPDLIIRLLQEAGLKPECLELELTEAVSMDDPLAVIAMMDALADLGVRISIDDFGTGYSSLSCLKRFKVSKLKIDRSFINDVMIDPDDRSIVKTIISLAKSLNLKTVAEGVETSEQLEFLKKCKCDEIQGYYFSRPLTANNFATYYRSYRPKS